MKTIAFVIILAFASVAVAYQYGDSISCTNTACEAIDLSLSIGTPKTIQINGKSFVFNLASLDGKNANIVINGKSYDIVFGNDELVTKAVNDLQDVTFNLQDSTFYEDGKLVKTEKIIKIYFNEIYICTGELKYSGCYNKYEIPVAKGWNLISTSALEDKDYELTTCDTNNMEKRVWFYDVENKKYIIGKDASKMSENSMFFLEAGSFWWYSTQDCKVVANGEKDSSSSSGYDKFFRIVTNTMEQSSKDFPVGWNFFSVSPDMTGKTLDDIKGTCQISKAYGWDPSTQEWKKIESSQKFESNQIGLGFVFKTSNECRLGETIAPPPAPPA